MINGHNYAKMRDARIVSQWERDICTHIVGISDASCGSLARYLALGVQPGGFMNALLSGDLREAIRRADANNENLIPDYVAYLMTLPPECWGTPEIVANWKGGIALEAV